MNNSIFVICEVQDNRINPASLDLIMKSLEIKNKKYSKVTAIYIGSDTTPLSREAISAGADIVYIIDDGKPGVYRSEHVASRLVTGFCQKMQPEILLIAATLYGRTIAPQIAALLGTGLTADCISLKIDAEGILVQTRPALGGNILAEIVGTGNLPQMATVLTKNTRPVLDNSKRGIIKKISCETIIDSMKLVSHEPLKLNFDFSQSDVIFAGGFGAGEEGFRLLGLLGEYLGCPVAATRAAVNAGLAPYSTQVGQTGSIVHPRVYIACGISGSIQHIVGMASSEYIVAVNTDQFAPIFHIADFGYVGDCVHFLEKLFWGLKGKN